ncbi:hypothetical protein [Candidatus Poriferisodalis sp.]|uniref:hypothetical protein n=1 Tax=Candidatus Poriferisodalis sp. TaxID=3101277 RepID=UPI003B024521
MTLEADRIQALHAAKLRALARSVLGVELAEVSGTDDGALAVAAGAEPAVVCLAQERPHRALGGALALAIRSGCDAAHVFADDHSGLLARRAACFTQPPAVWQIRGDSAVPAEPLPRPTEPVPPRVPELVSLLAGAGVEIAVEHGVITGEVVGLEVARIVPAAPAALASSGGTRTGDIDPHDRDDPATAWRIEVGVGAHDREAFGLLHADEPTAEAIGRVAETVRTHRSPGASPHPLNRMGAARWLRSLLIRQPELVDAGRLRAASPPVPRGGPKDPSPAVAYGLTPDGRRLVVVVCVGIDLDVVPFAADARLFLDPDAELTVALPRRDAHEVVRAMAARLDSPAEIVEIDDGWRTLSSSGS